MKTQRIGLILTFLFLGFSTTLQTTFAQSGRGGMNDRFNNNSPDIGELLPNILAYDADGKQLNIRSIKDHYSVIVFGCLT